MMSSFVDAVRLHEVGIELDGNKRLTLPGGILDDYDMSDHGTHGGDAEQEDHDLPAIHVDTSHLAIEDESADTEQHADPDEQDGYFKDHLSPRARRNRGYVAMAA